MTFYSNEMFLRRDGKLLKIEKPDSANANVHRELLLLELRDDWTVGGRPARGALLAADFEGFLKGERRFDVLFEPTERKSLAGFSPTLNHILLNELDNVRNRVYVLTRKDGAWTREALPGMPEFGTVSASGVDDEESDDYFLTVTDYLTPTSLSLGTVGKGAAEKLKQLPAFFDAKGLAVSQHEVASKDGTRIPYFQVARKDLALDGKNPTLLYGYGGFEVSEVPGYSGGVGSAWLEKGGVYVVANIRGGGEFGPKWHQAALKANRHRAYEDFIAVAEDLVRRKVTSDAPPRHPGRQQRRPPHGQHADHAARPLGRDRLPGAAARHAALQRAARRGELDGRVRQPRRPEGVGVHPGLLAVPQPEGRREVPADALHDLDARRPRPPRPRAQDDGAACSRRSRTSSTTRTSRAATAARPTTSSRPT